MKYMNKHSEILELTETELYTYLEDFEDTKIIYLPTEEEIENGYYPVTDE